MSTHINAAKTGEIAETILLPGDPLRAKFIAENFLEDVKCYTEIRNMLGFTGYYKGKRISVQGTGMGMPSMGIYSHELIHEYGCKNLIRIGTAGAFRKDIKIGDIMVAVGASTDSNYAHTFDLPGNFAPLASYNILCKVKEAADKNNIEFEAGNLVSCDVFYEEDPDWWKKWAKVGVMGVEMEAAALYMEAAKAKVSALAMVTVSDHFITGERSTTLERQNSFTNTMKLALETTVLL